MSRRRRWTGRRLDDLAEVDPPDAGIAAAAGRSTSAWARSGAAIPHSTNIRVITRTSIRHRMRILL